jgi:hypothetical protein
MFWPNGEPPPPPESRIVVRGPAGTNIFADDRHVGEIKPDGTFEFSLAAGAHQLRFDLSGHLPKSIDIQAADGNPVNVTVPTLEVISTSTATIRFRGLKPGTRVSIDGNPLGPIRPDGTLEANATPGDRKLEFELEGYKPFSLPVILTANQEFEVTEKEVTLTPLTEKPGPGTPPPTAPATLQVEATLPGIQVIVDDKPVGTTGPDGKFRLGQLQPGKHTIRLTHPGYVDAGTEHVFKAGEPFLYITTLAPAPAKVLFKAERGVRVSIYLGGKKPGAKPDHTFDNGEYRADLTPGEYEIISESQGRTKIEITDRITLKAGQSVQIDVRTPDSIDRLVLAVPAAGGNEIQEMDPWLSQGLWFSRTKPGFIFLDRSNIEGTVQFAVSLSGFGSNRLKRIRWTVGYNNAKQRILFELSKEGLWVIDPSRPKPENVAKFPGEPGTHIYLSLFVEAHQVIIRHQPPGAKGFVDLYKWPAPAASPRAALGRFGFLIEQGETLMVSNFRFEPKPK